MNIVKLQDIKLIHGNPLDFYTLTKKNQKEKLRKQSHSTQKKRYLGINLTEETKHLYAENYETLMKEIKDDTNRWRDYTMFLDRKNQYCENDYTTKAI